MAMAGMDPMRDFLEVEEPFRVIVAQAVALRAERFRFDERRQLANEVANEVGKLF